MRGETAASRAAAATAAARRSAHRRPRNQLRQSPAPVPATPSRRPSIRHPVGPPYRDERRGLTNSGGATKRKHLILRTPPRRAVQDGRPPARRAGTAGRPATPRSSAPARRRSPDRRAAARRRGPRLRGRNASVPARAAARAKVTASCFPRPLERPDPCRFGRRLIGVGALLQRYRHDWQNFVSAESLYYA